MKIHYRSVVSPAHGRTLGDYAPPCGRGRMDEGNSTRNPDLVTCGRCPQTATFQAISRRLREQVAMNDALPEGERLIPEIGSTWVQNPQIEGRCTITVTDNTFGMVLCDSDSVHGYGRAFGWDMWRDAVGKGWIVPADQAAGIIASLPAEIALVRLPAHSIAVAESIEYFNVSGPGVHNRNFRHKIMAFVGPCCEVSTVHLHMSAVATVIANKPQAPTVTLDTAIDTVIKVDRYPYRLVARRNADPILIPTRFDTKTLPN